MALKTEIIHFRVGPDLLAKLQDQACYQEMRLGEYVRYALAQYLAMLAGEEASTSDESD